MKNKTKKSVAFALAVALLAPTVLSPQIARADGTTPDINRVIVDLSENPTLYLQKMSANIKALSKDPKAQLDSVNESIKALETLNQEMPKAVKSNTNYGQELGKLLKTAWEIKDSVLQIMAGKIPGIDPETMAARVQLLAEITKTIQYATTQLTNKVGDAHVQLGFAVTRAVIRLLNPASTVEQMKASMEELQQTVAKVREYPDLSPQDRATIYVKAKLDKAIWEVRFGRDKNILGKGHFNIYNGLNKKITHAVGVWFRASATVAEVNQEIENLQAAYREALQQLALAETPVEP